MGCRYTTRDHWTFIDNETFDINEKALPADEVIPVKYTFKAKLNSYGGLDKLKARICVQGDMQIKDQTNLSDFIQEPKTISQVSKSSLFIKEKWGTAI